jgi:hypothetical protein
VLPGQGAHERCLRAEDVEDELPPRAIVSICPVTLLKRIPPLVDFGDGGDEVGERAAALLPGSILLRVNGYGHMTLLNTSTCVVDVNSAYLLEDVLPAAETWCARDRQLLQD